MKKIILVIALFIFPLTVYAEALVTGISVDGIGELKLNRKTWNLNLTTTLDYVDIDVTTASDTVSVEGAGKVEVQEGSNELLVKVSDGTSTEEYKININIARPSEDNGENPPTGDFVAKSLITSGFAGIFGICLIKRRKLYKI